MLTQPYDSSTPVTSNLTLYGKWSTLTYVVTYFDGNTSIATKMLNMVIVLQPILIQLKMVILLLVGIQIHY